MITATITLTVQQTITDYLGGASPIRGQLRTATYTGIQVSFLNGATEVGTATYIIRSGTDIQSAADVLQAMKTDAAKYGTEGVTQIASDITTALGNTPYSPPIEPTAIADPATLTSDATIDIRYKTVLVDATDSPVTITFPDPTEGWTPTIKKIDASTNAVTIIGSIDGASSYTLVNQWDFIKTIGDGTTHQKIG